MAYISLSAGKPAERETEGAAMQILGAIVFLFLVVSAVGAEIYSWNHDRPVHDERVNSSQ